jgi:hypothetical protein
MGLELLLWSINSQRETSTHSQGVDDSVSLNGPKNIFTKVIDGREIFCELGIVAK